ncbi:MAG TPA: heme o synthase [Thermoanaerobaculia bacterium]|nr:heme o synthase [Thermoanaerobaculia bacterium]
MTSLALDARPSFASVTRDYLELSKSRIVLMVLMTTAAGFLFAAKPVHPLLLLHALLGTALVAAGTNALNQYVEREHDAKMQRTRTRPLPAGRLSPRAALLFSSAIAILGTIYLGLAVNWLTAALGAFTLTSYIFVYTPLKRVSTICTLIGAIPGAVPPLMGWTAATGHLGIGGWILFGILFFWQLPHFMAISWMYRADYARGGFAMLAVQDDDGSAVGRQAVFYTLVLLPITIAPTLFGFTGTIYFLGAAAAGAVLLAAAMRFFFSRDARNARRLFMTSNVYLLVVMVLLVVSARAVPRVELPKLFAVPETRLVDERGRATSLASMKGSVTVYDFIFTNCAGTCPIMANNMRALTPKIAKDAPVRFVSISVDPTRDTPAVLAEYAERVRNDARWTFLTGNRDDVVKLSVQGFKLSAGDPTPGGDPLLHSSKFVVADKNGVIRGYFDAADGNVPEQVAKVVEQLLAE